MPARARRENKPELIFWVALAFLLLVAFTGGSSRVDVQSLVILKPAAVLACALALITLRPSHLASRKWLLIGFGAIFALSLLHLIPLPPGLWRNLPGRQELAAVDDLAGLGSVWRPLTVTPMSGWHALTSLFVPLAMLLLAVQLNRDDLYRFLPIVILLGALSGLVGLLQVVGNGSDSLYLYRETNAGSATGLFANRNHAALLLAILFPMLAVWTMADEDRMRRRMRQWAAIATGVVLFPLILATGSRSGLILSLVGLAAVFALFPFGTRESSVARPRLRSIAIASAAAAGILLLGLLTFYFSKAEAILRLLNTSNKSELRLDIWSVSFDMLWKYFPFGSGLGSFVEAYQVIEPIYQLNPYYRNHAHNDFLEIGITLGVPGLVLILIAALFFFRRSIELWIRPQKKGRAVSIARMASIAIFMIVMGSLVDYPLRTPMMMCIFTLLMLWLIEPDRERSRESAAARTEGGELR